MKYLVFARGADDVWINLGAVEVSDDVEEAKLAAVSKKATSGGPHAAVPFDEWELFEAEARVIVRPVPKAQPGLEQPDVETEVTSTELGEDDDMRGLVRPGQRLDEPEP